MEAEDGSVHLSLQMDSQERGQAYSVVSPAYSCPAMDSTRELVPDLHPVSVLWMDWEPRGLDIALGWVAAPLELRVSPARMMRIPARVAQEVDKLGSAWQAPS